MSGLAGALGKLRQALFSTSLFIVLLGFAAFAGVAGIAFLLLGVYRSLAERLPDWQAGAVVAAISAIVAGVVLLWARSRMMSGSSKGAGSSMSGSGKGAGPPGSPANSATVSRVDEAVALARRLSGTKPQVSEVAAAGFIAGVLVGMGSGEHSRSER